MPPEAPAVGRSRDKCRYNGTIDPTGDLPRAVRAARNGLMRLAAQIPAVRSQLAWRLSGLVYR